MPGTSSGSLTRRPLAVVPGSGIWLGSWAGSIRGTVFAATGFSMARLLPSGATRVPAVTCGPTGRMMG